MIYPFPYLLIIFIHHHSVRGLGIPTKTKENMQKKETQTRAQITLGKTKELRCTFMYEIRFKSPLKFNYQWNI